MIHEKGNHEGPTRLVVVMDEWVGLPEATTASTDSIVREGRAVAVSERRFRVCQSNRTV